MTRLNKLQAQLDRLVDEYLSTSMSVESFIKRSNKIRLEINRHRNTLQKPSSPILSTPPELKELGPTLDSETSNIIQSSELQNL